MATVIKTKKRLIKRVPEERESQLPMVTDADFYETIIKWQSLYPHTLGDELIKYVQEQKK